MHLRRFISDIEMNKYRELKRSERQIGYKEVNLSPFLILELIIHIYLITNTWNADYIKTTYFRVKLFYSAKHITVISNNTHSQNMLATMLFYKTSFCGHMHLGNTKIISFL